MSVIFSMVCSEIRKRLECDAKEGDGQSVLFGSVQNKVISSSLGKKLSVHDLLLLFPLVKVLGLVKSVLIVLTWQKACCSMFQCPARANS